MPKISVIMSSFNHEKFIADAIESVIGQTEQDFELLVVDDDSTDGSKSIITRYAEEDERIAAIFHRENMGIAATMNDGLDRAKGDFIAIIASDDLWNECKLERQLAVLDRERDVVVWSEGDIIDSSGRLTGERVTKKYIASPRKKEGKIFHELINGNFPFGSSPVYSRSILNHHRYDTGLRYFNDYKFWIELAKANEFRFVPCSLWRYRIHESNTVRDLLGYSRDSIYVCNSFLLDYDNQLDEENLTSIYSRLRDAYSILGMRNKALTNAIEYMRHSSSGFSSLVQLLKASTLADGHTRTAFKQMRDRLLDI